MVVRGVQGRGAERLSPASSGRGKYRRLADVDRPRTERIDGLVVRFTGLEALHRTLAEAGA